MIAVLVVLVTASAPVAESLQAVYDAAGPGEGYDKLLVLDPATLYTGGLSVDRGVRSCVHGNGARIDLQYKSIWVAGYETGLDIDHCVVTGGYSGLYIAEDADAIVRNNTFVGNGYGVTCWIGSFDTVIENNIMVGNSVYGVYCREYFEPFLQYNTVWGNTQGNYMKNCG
jgi:nitrous oxidase accessory protein NosD